jgi:hypothetical protein
MASGGKALIIFLLFLLSGLGVLGFSCGLGVSERVMAQVQDPEF